MTPVLAEPDPASGREVWRVAPGEPVPVRRGDVAHFLLLLVPMTVTATLGTISFSASDGSAIASFWPAAALQIAFSIWFGLPGALAGMVGPTLGNGLVGGSPLLFLSANALQSILPGVVFRRLKLDPRLRTPRDWAGLIGICCVASNALGAGLGVSESYLRALTAGGADQAASWWGNWGRWFLGNVLPCLVLTPALFKTTSAIIVRGPHFYQRFWRRTRRNAMCNGHFCHLHDMPIIAKLILLAIVAGIGPLCLLAGVAVWDAIAEANELAGGANRDGVMRIRDDVDRHELLLREYQAALDGRERPEDQHHGRFKVWQETDNAFTDLHVIDQRTLLDMVDPPYREVIAGLPVVFFSVERPKGSQSRYVQDVQGAIVLPSRPGKWLTGRCVWRETAEGDSILGLAQHVLVEDAHGTELYRSGVPDLADWRPAGLALERGRGIVRHAGRKWHVAEASSRRLGWRFLSLVSVQEAKAVVLSQKHNSLAILVNLAIFGALIGSTSMAGRIGGRVLTIAEHVERSAGRPGALNVPVGGTDELGYLSETLNKMSADMAQYVRELQETTAEKERLAHELELARRMQQAILPAHSLGIDGYELAATCRPAREVGGDFYDYFHAPRNQVALMIGDAAGKGLKAAMFMSETRGIARAAALDGLDPQRILQAVNRAMASDRTETSQEFITLFCGLLDPHDHRLHYASAGHCPPMIVGAGRTGSLQLGGLPVALATDGTYQLHQRDLAPGETVILYTDGVTEAMNPASDLFGEDRLEEIAGRYESRPARDLLNAVVSAIEEFAERKTQGDDVTLLVLRRLT